MMHRQVCEDKVVIDNAVTMAQSLVARAAMQAEVKNAVDKDTTEPILLHYWHTVRQRNPKTLIRPSRMILGSKNVMPKPSMRLLKGRTMSIGHTAEAVVRLNEASEDLCGSPGGTSIMRTMHAMAALRGWAVGSGDVGCAH